MKRQRKTTEVLDWEELEEAPNTRGAFSFLRSQGAVINIQEHRSQTAAPSSERRLETPENTVSEEKTVARTRPYRLHRCSTVQDAHSSGENQLYLALWKAGVPDQSGTIELDTRQVSIGWDRMAQKAFMSDKGAKRNLKGLIDKLAVELIAPECSNRRIGRTYRVYSFIKILERRKAAGLNYVVKDKGVRFATEAEIRTLSGDRILATVDKAHTVDKASTVDKTSTVTGDKTSTDAVDKTSPPLGSLLGTKNRKTTTVDVTALVDALYRYGAADDEAAHRIIRACRTLCPDVQLKEIVSVIHLKAPAIVRNRSVQNPLGLLITAIPQCFAGTGLVKLRSLWAAEEENERLRREAQERREAEMDEWVKRECQRCRIVLDDATSIERDRVKAAAQLKNLEPHLKERHA